MLESLRQIWFGVSFLWIKLISFAEKQVMSPCWVREEGKGTRFDFI